MGLQDTLSRLKERMSDYPHNYVPSILSFPDLNVNKIARDLKLSERGKERGERDVPSTDGDAFDDVENEVIEFIESEIKKADATLHDDLSTYAQRLHLLDFNGRISTIESAAMDGNSSFSSKVDQGKNALSLVGRRVRELGQEIRDFRTNHGLKRTAHYPSIAGAVWRWGLILLLFLLEVAGNSYFLAKGSAYGLIGGFAEAVIIAFLNLGGSMALGFYGLRQCWHRAFWRRVSGLLSLIGWLAFATAFNLLVAHYREAVGVFLEGGGATAIQALESAPFGFTDFQSWVLFGIGALFAFVAFVDAHSMDDPYPFYGKIDRTFEDSREQYVWERETLISDLEDIKDDTIEAMGVARGDLGKRLGEHGSILESHARARRAYDQHLTYLERAGNTLLSIYHEANREARKNEGPQRFKKAWQANRPHVPADLPTNIPSPKTLMEEVAQAQVKLDKKMREVHTKFEEAFSAYSSVDDVAGEHHAQTSAQTQ